VLAPTDLRALAAGISADLRVAGIRHAVTGAVALAVHGHVRATLDLDLLVVTPALLLPRVFEVVRGHGFEGDDRMLLDSLRRDFVAVLRRGGQAVEILVPALAYHASILDRARDVDIDGSPVPVVTAEDLVVLKLLWHRPKDLPDVHALVAARAEDLDVGYVRRTLAGIVPAGDSRLAEWEEIWRRYGAPTRRP
jgi:hypothetical protein